jgi:hypothetical protein
VPGQPPGFLLYGPCLKEVFFIVKKLPIILAIPVRICYNGLSKEEGHKKTEGEIKMKNTMLDNLEAELEKEGITDFRVDGDMDGYTVTIGGGYRQVLVDIPNDSEWHYLEVYNPNKDTFHYTAKRKGLKSVINYIYKHL